MREDGRGKRDEGRREKGDLGRTKDEGRKENKQDQDGERPEGLS